MSVHAASLVTIGLILVLVMALVKLTSHSPSQQSLPVTAKWVDEFSVERYSPMLRLLDQADLDSLRSQSGFTPQMETTFRIQRYQLFKHYVRHLDADFNRMWLALTVLMLQSKDDRPDLAFALVRSRMTFAYGMFLAQTQLAFYRYRVGTVDLSVLAKLIGWDA